MDDTNSASPLSRQDLMKQAPETYDEMFRDGGYQGVYDLPYWNSAYYPLFKQVLAEVERRDVRSILEVGCGTGAFAHLVMSRTKLEYHGFDFSRVAVSKASRRTSRPDAFFVADATASASYSGHSYDCVVCTEVLEHIEADREVVSAWASEARCVCSVPNFDADTHVRLFRSEDEVGRRYGDLIAIDCIVRVKKPVLSDISAKNVFRALRWNRYRPRRLLQILGLSTFNSVGGWFLFSGVRR
jgi:SAM-dependent methyltransferase